MKLMAVFGSCFLSYCFLINFGFEPGMEKASKNDSIQAIRILRKFPILNNNTGKYLGHELEEANIFYSQDYILQKLFYVHNILKVTPDGLAELDKKEIRASYFVYKKGSTTGYFSDSSRGLHFVTYPVDSVIAGFWHMQSFVDRLFENFDYWLIDSLSVRGNLYKNSYFFRNRVDSSQSGIITLEFSNRFSPVDFSLSPKMDTIQGMKLINVKIINRKRYLKDHGISVDEVEQSREIQVLKEFNISEIDPFFEFVRKRAADQ